MSQTSVVRTVTAGERLRRELLDVLRRADPAEQAGVLTELFVFYGQGFQAVQDLLAEEPSLSLWHAEVVHESLCGRVIYEGWQRSCTPFLARADYTRMTKHWQALVMLVLAKDK